MGGAGLRKRAIEHSGLSVIGVDIGGALKQAREAQCLPTGRQHDPVKVQEHRAQRTKVNDLKKEKVSPHKLRRQTVTDSYAVSPRGLTRPSYLCVGVVPDTTACTGMHSSLISYNYDDDDDYTSTLPSLAQWPRMHVFLSALPASSLACAGPVSLAASPGGGSPRDECGAERGPM